MYEVGGVPELGWPLGAVGKEEELSFLDWMFIGTVCNICFVVVHCIIYILIVIANYFILNNVFFNSTTRKYSTAPYAATNP